MAIIIQNKLEVLLGNKVLVPGCEPITAFTSPTLAANIECNGSVVDLADALEALPGSTIEEQKNPRRLFFVLPSGPPPAFGCTNNSCGAQPDWYQILRSISEDIPAELKTIKEIEGVVPGRPRVRNFPDKPLTMMQICESFPLKGIFA